MSSPVRYHCPRCGTVVTLHRSGYLADQSVTPYPLEGWSYAEGVREVAADDDADPYAEADGVRLVCGGGETDADERVEFDGPGCGEPYYLNFVRFEGGRRVEPDPASEFVELAHPDRPAGPRSPGGR